VINLAADRDKIVEFCNDYLKVNEIKDYGRNGMQVEGREEVNKIVLGVSASLELFKKAAEKNADMVIVHHGLFWEGDSTNPATGKYDFHLDGFLKKRVKHLLDNDISLLAYHHTLDAHPVIGNNAQFLLKAQLRLRGEFGTFLGTKFGVYSETKISIDELINRVNSVFDSNALTFKYGPEICKRIGFISGHGFGAIDEAMKLDLDTYITGSVGEKAPAIAKELGMNLIAAGHYNSEKLGVRALGELIQKRFKVEVEFIDVPNIL